jgi:effector-binding domain-containing protein
MTYLITIETVAPRILAAVNRRVQRGLIGAAFVAVQDDVWSFLRSNPGLHSDGHNIFYYNHAGNNADGLDVHFGVEVTRPFEPSGRVACVETPGGRAVVTAHRGAYTGLSTAHAALRDWFRANDARLGAWSLEIYGDWHENEGELETTIIYALA